jgi:DNA polymerase-4
VAGDLQHKGYVGRTIGIKLRYDDFQIATRDQTLGHFTADAATIRQTAGQCLKRVDLSRRLRLLGVRVGKLARAGTAQTAQPIATDGATAGGAMPLPPAAINLDLFESKP